MISVPKAEHLNSFWYRGRGVGGGGTRKWPFVSGYWKNSRLPSTRTSRSSKQRRFWAKHVDQKWTYSFLICLVASKFVLLRVFSLIETICPKTCLKSSLKSAKSPLPVDAHPSKWSLLFRHHQSTIVVPKNGKYYAMHHPRRTLGSCWSPQIPWSWAIQWSKLLGLWQKANRSLGVKRRNLSKCRENVKELAYLTLVRPQLEFADAVHGIRTFKNR